MQGSRCSGAGSEAELVRETFGSEAELAEHLGNDLYRLQSGEPLGYSAADVWARWMAFEAGERERLFRYELAGRSPLVPSPLAPEWSSFLEQPGWHERIGRDLRTARNAAVEFQELSRLVEAIAAIDVDADYPTLRGALGPLTEDRWHEQLQRLADRRAAGASGSAESKAPEYVVRGERRAHLVIQAEAPP